MRVKNMAEKSGETGRGREWEKRRKEQAERTELWGEKGLVGQKKLKTRLKKREERRLHVKGEGKRIQKKQKEKKIKEKKKNKNKNKNKNKKWRIAWKDEKKMNWIGKENKNLNWKRELREKMKLEKEKRR